jgi:hypothetical protein
MTPEMSLRIYLSTNYGTSLIYPEYQMRSIVPDWMFLRYESRRFAVAFGREDLIWELEIYVDSGVRNGPAFFIYFNRKSSNSFVHMKCGL